MRDSLFLDDKMCKRNEHIEIGYQYTHQFNSLLDLLGHIQKLALLDPNYFKPASLNVAFHELALTEKDNKEEKKE